MMDSTLAARAAACAALLAAGGCAQLHPIPKVQVIEPVAIRAPTTGLPVPGSASGVAAPGLAGAAALGGVPVVPVQVAVPPVSTPGAIYSAATFRPLFDDRRARFAGDVLTILIQEKTSARQQSNTALNRDGKVEGAIAALPLLSGSLLGRARIGGSSSNALEGKGETGSNNTFTGAITVTVLDVLPNGNLLVAGEKQVGINQNVDVMRFSGVVNPVSILPGNAVSSTQVAEARLEYRGRGDIDRAQTTGWLSRFFLSWLPI